MTRWDHALHDAIRDRLTLGRRRRLALARLAVRQRVPLERALPGALIVGAQRGGTSSLYAYLGRHPDGAPSLRKEVGYFTMAYGRGPAWYAAHFHLAAREALHRLARGRPLLAFEATPDYLLDPRAAARAAALLPAARIIVLLRNPVERAWSHWAHMHRRGLEPLSFEDAVRAEPDRLGDDLARLASVDPLDPARDAPLPKAVVRFSYVERGRYGAQLGRWAERYPREQILVLRSEDFYADTPRVFGAIVDFLGLAPWRPDAFRNVSLGDRGSGAAPAPRMERAVRARLEDELLTDLAEVTRLLGREPGWAGPSP